LARSRQTLSDQIKENTLPDIFKTQYLLQNILPAFHALVDVNKVTDSLLTVFKLSVK